MPGITLPYSNTGISGGRDGMAGRLTVASGYNPYDTSMPGPQMPTSGLSRKRSTRIIPPTAWHGGGEDVTDNEAEIQQRLAEQRLRALQGLLGQFGFGSPATSPNIPAPGGPAGDENLARASAFARAKDQAGQTARASLTALEGLMANRGQAGSGLEGELSAGIISGGAGRVNEFTREQAIQDLNRAAEISDRNYQGAITQRGQDLGARQQSLSALLQLINSIY